MSLSHKFCIYLHSTLFSTSWHKHERRKRQSTFLYNKNTLQVKNFRPNFCNPNVDNFDEMHENFTVEKNIIIT